MELDNIITLIKAGYTKEDIEKMEAPAADPDPEEKDTDPAPAEDPAPAVTSPAAKPENTDQILAALNNLTNAIMKKNLNVTTAESASPQTTQDILAKVIAPPKKEK